MREGIPGGKAELEILAPSMPSSVQHLKGWWWTTVVTFPTRLATLYSSHLLQRGEALADCPSSLGCPRHCLEQVSGGKPSTAAAEEQRAACLHYGRRRRRRWGPSRKSAEWVRQRGEHTWNRALSVLLLTEQCYSCRHQLQKSLEGRRDTATNSCTGVFNKTRNLPSSEHDPTLMVAWVVNPLEVFGELDWIVTLLWESEMLFGCDVMLRE